MLSDLFIRSIKLKYDLPEASYLNDLPVIQHLRQLGELPFSHAVTFIVGDNGVGKSTLIEAIAVNIGFNAEGGGLHHSFATVRTHSPLHESLAVIKGTRRMRDGFFLRAESFYNVATYVDVIGGQESYGNRSLHAQSHGESFLTLVEHRFGANGLYILDEPEAALSPFGLLRLMCYMQQLVQQGCQFIISTHSPMLMAFPGAQVLQLSVQGIEAVDYRDTEHYQLTQRFLADPQRMLAELLKEE